MYFEHLIGGGSAEKLAAKVDELKLDLDQWVKDSDEMSIAHLKELFVQVVIIGDTYEEAIHTLKSMTEVLEDKEYETEMGFAPPSKTKDFYD